MMRLIIFLIFYVTIKSKDMQHIVNLVLLGLFAGFVSGFWTRIIKKNMIFAKIGKRLERYNNDHLIMFNEPSKTVYLLRCIYCMTPYIAVVFDVAYIIFYTPYWLFCVIGILASIGAGNFVAEITCALRGNE